MLDVQHVTSIADYFIICTATSNRMLNALADAVRDKVQGEYQKKGRTQGSPEAGWIVIDYGDVVIHLFDSELRRYYNLEELWKEAKVLLRLQ